MVTSIRQLSKLLDECKGSLSKSEHIDLKLRLKKQFCPDVPLVTRESDCFDTCVNYALRFFDNLDKYGSFNAALAAASSTVYIASCAAFGSINVVQAMRLAACTSAIGAVAYTIFCRQFQFDEAQKLQRILFLVKSMELAKRKKPPTKHDIETYTAEMQTILDTHKQMNFYFAHELKYCLDGIHLAKENQKATGQKKFAKTFQTACSYLSSYTSRHSKI